MEISETPWWISSLAISAACRVCVEAKKTPFKFNTLCNLWTFPCSMQWALDSTAGTYLRFWQQKSVKWWRLSPKNRNPSLLAKRLTDSYQPPRPAAREKPTPWTWGLGRSGKASSFRGWARFGGTWAVVVQLGAGCLKCLHQPGWVMTRCAFFKVHAQLGVCTTAQEKGCRFAVFNGLVCEKGRWRHQVKT